MTKEEILKQYLEFKGILKYEVVKDTLEHYLIDELIEKTLRYGTIRTEKKGHLIDKKEMEVFVLKNTLEEDLKVNPVVIKKKVSKI